MVVISGSWVKNVATYPIPPLDVMLVENDKKMTAKAVLICRPNSHPFQDRTLTLDQAVKVGRSVARARATATNAIFDCKVLSRHHALLWYEDGKFFLQDTKSSNGTFVNNNRLAPESEQHEVSSGDIVQFGVDVVENNRKVTHGCIVATLKLYLPDGKEAKASATVSENNKYGIVPLDELYKLNQIIQEAAQREQCLETKLSALQNAVNQARKSAEESWQAFVDEERLLSRISALETQLQQGGKNWGDDKYKEELNKLQEDISAYQIAAKETLEKLHNERLEALNTATEQERAKVSSELEILVIKEQLNQAQTELEDVARRLYDEQKKSFDDKIQLEMQLREIQERLELESEKAAELQAKVDMYSLRLNIDKHIVYNDNLKLKGNNLYGDVESDCDSLCVDLDQDRINLSVAPAGDLSNQKSNIENDSKFCNENNSIVDTEREKEKRVSFFVPQNDNTQNGNGQFSSLESVKEECGDENDNENEKDDTDSDQIDSKTLKYKYQSAQIELKKKIEQLESIINANKNKIAELEANLVTERQSNEAKMKENDSLKTNLIILQQKLKESCNEKQQLKDKIEILLSELGEARGSSENVNNSIISQSSVLSYDQLVDLEEELVLLKERYADLNNANLKLRNDYSTLKERYCVVCNRSSNILFVYVLPLILCILYLLYCKLFS